jgi:hypothetical protein
MMGRPLSFGGALLACALAVLAALVPDAATADSVPSGERILGQSRIEPAYDYSTGALVYLLTPINAPFPATQIDQHAVAPLYLVVYPPGTPGILNCMGIPGNCPDHDLKIATAATKIMPSVYGTDPSAVPGHDHLAGVPRTGGDFNVAWHVVLVLFTPRATLTHLTTLSQLDAAKASDSVVEVSSPTVFMCSVVPQTTYMMGTPV